MKAFHNYILSQNFRMQIFRPDVITGELSYINLGLCDTSYIKLHIQWYHIIPHKAHGFLPCLVQHTQGRLPRK